MFDAREALMPGRVIGPGFPPQMDPTATYQDAYFRTHDRMGYIGAERTVAAAVGNIPIPVGMFLPPMPPQPPHSYYNQVSVFCYISLPGSTRWGDTVACLLTKS